MNDLEQFGLNERQRLFVAAVVAGRPLDVAALEAGYEEARQGTKQAKRPHVLAAIHHGIQRALQTDAAVSLAVLRKIRDDEAAPARVRADIGLKMLQLAGHTVPTAVSGSGDKSLAEMSREEMVAYIDRNQAAIDRAESELAARAKDVSASNSVSSSVPKSTDAPPKPLDFLD